MEIVDRCTVKLGLSRIAVGLLYGNNLRHQFDLSSDISPRFVLFFSLCGCEAREKKYPSPTLMLGSARSINNKIHVFQYYLTEQNVDMSCMTETWVRVKLSPS